MRGTWASPAEPEDEEGRGGGGYSQWGQGHAAKPCSGRIRKDLVLKQHDPTLTPKVVLRHKQQTELLSVRVPGMASAALKPELFPAGGSLSPPGKAGFISN